MIALTKLLGLPPQVLYVPAHVAAGSNEVGRDLTFGGPGAMLRALMPGLWLRPRSGSSSAIQITFSAGSARSARAVLLGAIVLVC